MKRWLCAAGAAVILAGLAGGLVYAQTFPPPIGFVSDFANLLSPQARTELEARLSRLEQEFTAEVAVVTIDSLEGDTIEDYAVQLFDNWGIGAADEDNGVLFITALTEREVRIEVGYGLESIITDGRAGRILDREVIPHFKDGDYEAGILAGAAAIENYIRNGTPPPFIEDNPVGNVVGGKVPMWLIVTLGIITIYMMGFMARTKSIWLGGIWGIVVGLVLGLVLGSLIATILLPIGAGMVGTLLDLLLSRNYRQRKSSNQSTGWWRSGGGFMGPYAGGGGSSGGFGGFHGGSSGGGGASRRW